MDRLQQHSIVIYVLGARPNRAGLHHLLVCKVSWCEQSLDIQFLHKACYHVEFISGAMMHKLLMLGSVKLRGIWMQFLKWCVRFNLDDMSNTISRCFVFYVLFPALPKKW